MALAPRKQAPAETDGPFGGGLFWSLANVNGVYANEHTWITASRWMYDEAPSGSVILWEEWDHPLPTSIPGEAGMHAANQGLRHIARAPYAEDTEEKYEILRQKLREEDYVIYSSNRLYGSEYELRLIVYGADTLTPTDEIDVWEPEFVLARLRLAESR